MDKKLRHTFCFWMAFAGVGVLHPKTRSLSSAGLLLAGAGFAGVLWERQTGSDLRRIRDIKFKDGDVRGLLLHALLAGIGWRALKGR
jgi:hypothetical protein